jgi:hypothetical protein
MKRGSSAFGYEVTVFFFYELYKSSTIESSIRIEDTQGPETVLSQSC